MSHRVDPASELLALAEEVAQVGHFRVDLPTRRVHWSPHVYAIHGRDPDGFAPALETAADACHPDDRQRAVERVKAAAERGEAFDLEVRLVRPDGELRRVRAKGRCETDPSTRETTAIFGVLLDVTEREELRERVVRHERLVTVGALAAGLGHEINNPLAFVTTNLEMAIEEVTALAAREPSDQLRELWGLLRDARVGADRIRKVVQGLRAFARVDGDGAAGNVLAALDLALSVAGHELSRRATLEVVAENVPLVSADEGQLSQVFVHLLVNAAQAFASGDPETNRVVVRTATRPSGEVEVSVSDNGPGIAADVLPRIFDAFFTTKPKGQGAGLGLAIAEGIAHSLGGELSCESRQGEGATFRLVLPPAAPTAVEGGRLTPAERARAKILVIDDEIALLRSFTRVLGEECAVVTLEDPRQAFEVLERDGASFDAVFCDLVMPHVSGVDVYTATLVRDPELARRFVFMSGGATTSEAQEILRSTANERLEKPFGVQALRALARRMVRLRGRRP
jgi:PAS domain S-box-containing protein